MESGFDFSQLKWIIIFAVFVIYKYFGAKPKVEDPPIDGESPLDEVEGETVMRRFEELFGDLTSTAPSAAPEFEEPRAEESRRRVERAATKRVVPAVAQRPRVGGVDGEEITSSIGENSSEDHHSIAEDFDLQKAVIMSEILSRKYDE